MPPQDRGSSGVQSPGDMGSFFEQNAQAQQMLRARKEETKLNKDLLARLKELETQVKSGQVPAYKLLNDTQEKARKTATAYADVLTRSSGYYTEAQKSEQARESLIKKVARDEVKTYEERTILTKGMREGELAIFRNSLQKHKETGMEAIGAGKDFSDTFKNALTTVWAKTTEVGQSVGEFSGKMFGVSAAAMENIAGIAGAVLLVFKAFSDNISEGAKGAAGASLDIGNSFSDLALNGSRYSRMLAETSMQYGAGALMTGQELQKLVEIGNKQFLPSLYGIGDGYTKFIKGSDDVRFAMVANAARFVADVSFVGKKFGQSAEESVTMATRIGAVSRSVPSEALRSYYTINKLAQDFGYSTEKLVNVYASVATAQAYAGKTGKDAAKEMLAFNDTIDALRKSGTAGFRNLNADQQLSLIQKTVDASSKINETLIAAIKMGSNPNKSLEFMFSEIGDLSAQKRASALIDGVKNSGFNRNTPNSNLFTGMLAMPGGNHAEQIQLGKALWELQSRGKLTEESTMKAMGNILDQRIAQAKSVGEFIAAGGDPAEMIARILQNILAVIIGFATSYMFRTGTAGEAAAEVPPALYGKGGGGGYSRAFVANNAELAQSR